MPQPEMAVEALQNPPRSAFCNNLLKEVSLPGFSMSSRKSSSLLNAGVCP